MYKDKTAPAKAEWSYEGASRNYLESKATESIAIHNDTITQIQPTNNKKEQDGRCWKDHPAKTHETYSWGDVIPFDEAKLPDSNFAEVLKH